MTRKHVCLLDVRRSRTEQGRNIILVQASYYTVPAEALEFVRSGHLSFTEIDPAWTREVRRAEIERAAAQHGRRLLLGDRHLHADLDSLDPFPGLDLWSDILGEGHGENCNCPRCR